MDLIKIPEHILVRNTNCDILDLRSSFCQTNCVSGHLVSGKKNFYKFYTARIDFLAPDHTSKMQKYEHVLANVLDNQKYLELCNVIAEGYRGTQSHVRAVIMIKKRFGRHLSSEEHRSNAQIATDKIILVVFF